MRENIDRIYLFNRYITPSPLQYKPESDNDTIDIRSQISPTSPNSKCFRLRKTRAIVTAIVSQLIIKKHNK